MSFLSNATSGTTTNGQRIVISGVEKIGKTTLACDAPNALLIPLEMGYASQTCRRVSQLEWWEHVEALCQELLFNAQNAFIADPAFVPNPEDPAAIADWVANPTHLPAGTTLVWDSATALERLIHSRVLRTDPAWAEGNPRGVTMNSAHGGYGKGYHVANELFTRWLAWMDQLSMLGINIVVTCHVFAADVIDPAYGEYNSWDILLHSPKNQKEYGKRELLTQWADLVGFYHEPIFITKEKGDELAKGVSQGKGRVLAVERTPAWVAGNRYKMRGEVQIPTAEGGWNYLAKAIHDASGIDVFKR